MIKITQPVIKTTSPAERPAPPKDLMQYGEMPERHLISGRKSYDDMIEACGKFGVSPSGRVLDFGCSNGRVTRWYDSSKCEVWGADVDAAKIMWANEHLSPIRFVVTDASPHLPFQDGYFDFICAQSVFTHLQETHIAWLLELCRILSPGASMFITLHDRVCMESGDPKQLEYLLAGPLKGFYETAKTLDGLGFFSMSIGTGATAYMSEEYFRSILPPWMELLGTVPRAYSELQTGYVIRHR